MCRRVCGGYCCLSSTLPHTHARHCWATRTRRCRIVNRREERTYARQKKEAPDSAPSGCEGSGGLGSPRSQRAVWCTFSHETAGCTFLSASMKRRMQDLVWLIIVSRLTKTHTHVAQQGKETFETLSNHTARVGTVPSLLLAHAYAQQRKEVSEIARTTRLCTGHDPMRERTTQLCTGTDTLERSSCPCGQTGVSKPVHTSSASSFRLLLWEKTGVCLPPTNIRSTTRKEFLGREGPGTCPVGRTDPQAATSSFKLGRDNQPKNQHRDRRDGEFLCSEVFAHSGFGGTHAMACLKVTLSLQRLTDVVLHAELGREKS